MPTKKTSWYPALLWPGMIWLGAFFFVPLALVVICSFLRRDPLGGIEFTPTWDNYARMIDPVYLSVTWRSLKLASVNTSICLIVAYPIAYFIAFDARPTSRPSWLFALLLPFWIPMLVRVYAWFSLLRTEGPVNRALLWSGLVPEPVPLLFSETAVAIGMVSGYLPLMLLPLYVSLDRLAATRLIQASADLGATPLQTFVRIVLPATRSGVLTGALLVFVPSLGEYVIPTLLGGGKSYLLGNLIADQFLMVRNYPQGFAVAVALLAAGAAALAAALRFLKEAIE